MAYQALARTYRPKNFHEMVGQEHIVKALTNALDANKVHHAFLFTGTRGVGKTTIARVLSKSLNCEKGVTSTPCGKCAACIAIDEGRFIDLIEVDAASKTKVEDTREILENVQYTPTNGRFKIYLIDEVHMLSKHSFNALLKTLEEPPPYVKFLLATTDPQKLPITILSRCLQFNLKSIPEHQIASHINNVLAKEGYNKNDGSSEIIARHANGSMRDALSLLDQAIAFTSGTLDQKEVLKMLGAIDTSYIHDILRHIAGNNAHEMIMVVSGMAERSIDFSVALDQMISVLHKVALHSVAPDAINGLPKDREAIKHISRLLPIDNIQTYYQIAINGRRDLPLSSDPRTGFEMTLIKMITLSHPDEYNFMVIHKQCDTGAGAQSVSVAGRAETDVIERQPVPADDMEAKSETTKNEPDGQGGIDISKNVDIDTLTTPSAEDGDDNIERIENVTIGDERKRDVPTLKEKEPEDMAGNEDPMSWGVITGALRVSGLSKQLAINCAPVSISENEVILALPESFSHLSNKRQQERLKDALEEYFKGPISLKITVGEPPSETIAQKNDRVAAQKRSDAETYATSDEKIMMLQKEFGASVFIESVVPIES